MKKPKSKLIIYLEYIPARIGILFAKMAPLSLSYAIMNVVCRIAFLFDKKHRTRSIQHILHSGIVKTYPEAKKLSLKNFIHFGKVGVELVKIQQILTPENMYEYVCCNISEEAREAMLDPRGTVCASAHYGNWEITGLSLSVLFRAIVSIGRKLDNPKLNEYVFRKRGQFKQEIYSKDGGVKNLLKGLKQSKLLGILIDQHPGDNVGVMSDFFGHPCWTHDSPAMLHLKTGAPLMLAITRRLDDKFHFELLIKGPFKLEPTGSKEEDIKQLTIKINKAVEEIVRECPEQWSWAPRRWMDINRDRHRKRR